MRFQLTNDRGEVIETIQADIKLSVEQIDDIRRYVDRLSAKFNRLKAEISMLNRSSNLQVSLYQICDFVNQANLAYDSSLHLVNEFSKILAQVSEYEMIVRELHPVTECFVKSV